MEIGHGALVSMGGGRSGIVRPWQRKVASCYADVGLILFDFRMKSMAWKLVSHLRESVDCSHKGDNRK